jgi:hypothetical protein
MSLTSRALGGDAAIILDELWHFDSQSDAGQWLSSRLDAVRSPGKH